MIQFFSVLFTRARYILKDEGLMALLSRVVTFSTRRFLQYGAYSLYEHTMKERNEAAFMPNIQNFTFKVISTNLQADELVRGGFGDFRQHFTHARRALNKGAIAFCIFVGPELAHIGWVAMTEEAKRTFDALPYRVDFSAGQACTGGTVTMPKYRGNGFMTYGYFKRLQFFYDRGFKTSRNAVAEGNVPSQRAHARFGPRIYAKARYLRIMGWKFWREQQLTQQSYD